MKRQWIVLPCVCLFAYGSMGISFLEVCSGSFGATILIDAFIKFYFTCFTYHLRIVHFPVFVLENVNDCSPSMSQMCHILSAIAEDSQQNVEIRYQACILQISLNNFILIEKNVLSDYKI